MTLTEGSLCTGYNGYGMAVERALGDVELAFVADTDRAAAKLLACRYPDVPNLGDITNVDWTRIPRVDVLTAGYPCQGESVAGHRRGAEDERWVWDGVFAAIRDLRPRIVLLENVSGHLSLGFGRVLGDLASIGFDARWMCLRASDVGAAHRRERVFIYAFPADAEGDEGRFVDGNHGAAASGNGWGGAADLVLSLLPTPAATRSGRQRSPSPGAAVRPSLDMISALLTTPDATHGRNTTRTGLLLPGAIDLLPTPRASANENRQTHRSPSQIAGTHGLSLAAEVCTLLPTPRASDGPKGSPNQGYRNGPSLSAIVQPGRWGPYAEAIERWEKVTGVTAPEPTQVGKKGPRLSPRFVEWLLGLPAGWVTDVPGLSRNDELRLLGNGIVPQQGAEAVLILLGVGR